MPARIKVDTTDTWGYLRYISEAVGKNEKSGHSRRYVNCLCDPELGGCGNVKEISLNRLTCRENVKSCGCLQRSSTTKAHTAKKDKAYNIYKFDDQKSGAFGSIVYRYKVWAKKRNLIFELTEAECYRLFKSDCRYCRSKPKNVKTATNNKTLKFLYNGIDRVDNNKGYVLDNVVSCCKICNYAKNNLSCEEFRDWIKRIMENNKDMIMVGVPQNQITPRDLRDINDMAIKKYNEYPARCRMSDTTEDLTHDDLIALARFESSLILLNKLGYLTSEQIENILPNLYQKTQESVNDE